MFWKVTIAQTKYLLRTKEVILVFLVMFGLVLYNFVGNVMAYQGMDVVEMYHPMKIMLLSYNRTVYNAENTLLFVQIYPFLVALPGGLALAKEYQRGEHVYMSARLGRKMYQFSKVAAAFLTTVIVFTVPFLMEFVLHCVSFPLHAKGDLTNWSSYNDQYLEWVSNYFMTDLFTWNPFVYALVGILLFGIVSGVLGAVTVMISGLIRIKFNVFLLLPAFALLYVSTMLTTQFSPFSYRWYDYMLLFNYVTKNNFFFIGAVGLLVLVVMLGTLLNSRKDCL